MTVNIDCDLRCTIHNPCKKSRGEMEKNGRVREGKGELYVFLDDDKRVCLRYGHGSASHSVRRLYPDRGATGGRGGSAMTIFKYNKFGPTYCPRPTAEVEDRF